jgi:hypothetical protein
VPSQGKSQDWMIVIPHPHQSRLRKSQGWHPEVN